MSRLRRALFGPIFVALPLFGWVADHALVEQGRLGEQAALSDLEERARLTALSVRSTLARVEESVLAAAPMPAVTMGQVPVGTRAGPRGNTVPYGKRPRKELVPLLSSAALTTNGLPEAVVAAVALGDAGERARVAKRLLSGLLPVGPDDLPYLAAVLRIQTDPRVGHLMAFLRRAPDPTALPLTRDFHRMLTERGTVEAWVRNETGLRGYEIASSALLDRAGVADRAALLASFPGGSAPGRRLVSVPDSPGLVLAVAPNSSGRFRIRTLRVVLWIAVATSLIGLAAMIRAIGREARAVAKEKAFLASITHELRTPLAAIRLFGETLAEGRGDPPEYGALVAQESQRLEALVDHVLAITRIDEAPVFVKVKPDEIVASAVRLIAARAEQRSVGIDWHAADAGLPEAYWDADSVRRALLNLLDNAVKHGKPCGRVAVHAAVEGDQVALSVADEGPGIGHRDRKRVFGRFERGSSDGSGTGLGLYVVEQVARAHGGRVDLVTEENHGSTFTLVLPLRPRGAALSAGKV